MVGSTGDLALGELIAAAKAESSDNSEPMNELLRRFERHAMHIAMMLTERVDIHDDLVTAALMGFVKAVRRHEPCRSGFTTYARRYMEGAARRELRVLIPWTDFEFESLSEPATLAKAEAVMAPIVAPGMYTWGHGKAGQIVRMLPERQRHLLTRCYVDDAPLAEIATESGTSVAAVSQRLATARRAVASRLIA